MGPRETENNAYAKSWGDKQRVIWYVMVFSGVVNRFFGIRDFSYLGLGIRNSKAKPGRDSVWKFAREIRWQKQSLGYGIELNFGSGLRD